MFAGVEATDGFAGCLERGVGAVNERLGDDCDDGFFLAASMELVFEGLLDLVTDCTLGVCADGVERDGMEDAA